jgi:hypothetical protein
MEPRDPGFSKYVDEMHGLFIRRVEELFERWKGEWEQGGEGLGLFLEGCC